MPCQHIAVATTGSSKAVRTVLGSRATFEFEHHAIFDAYDPNGPCYIHVSSIGSVTDEMRVIRTPKRIFEREFPARPQVLAEPAGLEEGRQILLRARDMIDGPNDGAWHYNEVTSNCEHFVRQCWTQDEGASSQQVQATAATVGGSGAFGMVAAGAGTWFPVSGLTSTVTVPASGVAGWFGGTMTSIVPALPAGAVATIAIGGALLGGLALGAAGLGTLELVRHHRAMTAELVPVAIKNRSNRQITASLSNLDGPVPALQDALHQWRALLEVGAMSCEISPEMFGELNPAAVEDGSAMSRRFRLTVEGQTRNVCRGDVLVFDGQDLMHITIPDEEDGFSCTICFERSCNVVLQPCGHFQFCDQCYQSLVRHAWPGLPSCPLCREDIRGMERDTERI